MSCHQASRRDVRRALGCLPELRAKAFRLIFHTETGLPNPYGMTWGEVWGSLPDHYDEISRRLYMQDFPFVIATEHHESLVMHGLGLPIPGRLSHVDGKGH